MFVNSYWHKKGLLLLLLSLLLPLSVQAMDAPESVTIDVLVNYYEAVEFDHEMHVDVSEDCSVCHHHTTGTGTTDLYCARCHNDFEEQDLVSCQDCHAVEPFSAEVINRQSQQDIYHVDLNGLMGAYHQNCLGCHQDVDGPTGCEDCHSRTEKGDDLFHSGQFAPASPDPVTAGH